MMSRSSVLFPEPDGPMRLTTSPRSTEKLTPSRTRWSPNDLLIPSSTSSGKTALQDRPEAGQRVGQGEVEAEDRPVGERAREAFRAEQLPGVGQLQHADLGRER